MQNTATQERTQEELHGGLYGSDSKKRDTGRWDDKSLQAMVRMPDNKGGGHISVTLNVDGHLSILIRPSYRRGDKYNNKLYEVYNGQLADYTGKLSDWQ